MELREQTRYLLIDPDLVEKEGKKYTDDLSSGHFSVSSQEGDISDQVMDAS